jgi:hypothetical protein
MNSTSTKTIDTLRFSFLRLANKRTKNSRALRRLGIWAYCNLTRANIFLPPPKVLLNGPGKSGTHLLSDCLSLLPNMRFSGRHFSLAEFAASPNRPEDVQFYLKNPSVALDANRLQRFLNACPNGMFVSAHARSHPALRAAIKQLNFKHLVLLRDPRDVAVSYTFFVLRERWHHHHGYYSQILKNDDERLIATIRGFTRAQSGEFKPLASIGEIFQSFLPWLEDSSVLFCRFEDLVGPRGGGRSDKQIQEVQRIAEFVQRPINEPQAFAIAENMYSENSMTFRKGSIDQWRHHFRQEHKTAFKEIANSILIRLGYEEDENW